jgi:hypothetical protein
VRLKPKKQQEVKKATRRIQICMENDRLLIRLMGCLKITLSLKKQRSKSVKKDRPPKEDGLCDFLLIDSISKKTRRLIFYAR